MRLQSSLAYRYESIFNVTINLYIQGNDINKLQ